jgi:hypothetical protein
MAILFVGGVLIGAILGQYCKWVVLIPVYGIVIFLFLANLMHAEHSLLGWVTRFVVVAASLQLGYIVKLTARLAASNLQRPAAPDVRRPRSWPA